MSCNDCLSRREFLTRSTLAVAGAAVASTACGDGQFGATPVTPAPVAPTPGAPAAGTVTLKVSTIPALATTGQLVVIPPANAQIAVKRTGPTTFVALSTVCTHQGTTTNIVDNAFVCPNHGSRFDNSGMVTRQPTGGGAATNLPTFPTRYDATTDILTIG